MLNADLHKLSKLKERMDTLRECDIKSGSEAAPKGKSQRMGKKWASFIYIIIIDIFYLNGEVPGAADRKESG